MGEGIPIWLMIAGAIALLVLVGGFTEAGHRTIDFILARLSEILLVIAAILGFLLAFVVCADVGGRYFFDYPIQGTPELVSMAIVMICYLQAGYAVRSGGMIAVDAFYANMPTWMKGVVAIVGSLLGFGFFALIFWGSYERAVDAWVSGEFEGEGAMRVPAWPTKWSLVVGCALASLSYLLLAIKQLGQLTRGQEPTMAASSH